MARRTAGRDAAAALGPECWVRGAGDRGKIAANDDVGCYTIPRIRPPSTRIIDPVTYLALSLARNAPIGP